MTVYLDYLFVQNFIFDLILIVQTKFLSKIQLDAKRAIFSSIVSSIYICVLVVTKQPQLNYFGSRILLSFVIVYIAFKPESLEKYIKITAVFYVSLILTLGISVFVSQMLCDGKRQELVSKVVVYLVVLLLTFVVTKQFWKIYKFNIKKQNLNMAVEVTISGHKYIYNGFMDTGNTVYSYELGVPIVFAEYISDEQKNEIRKLSYVDIPVSTISKMSNEKAVLLKGKMLGKEIKIGVVFVENKLNKDNAYNMILNYKMFEENLGGICV